VHGLWTNSVGSSRGYLLRDVINLVNDIHFDSSDEIHTLSRLYEGLLREMHDAVGDSGEFYTPRPLVQFIVEVVDPRLGEVVLDPACGAGGFLAEAFMHLEKQADTVERRDLLQRATIRGGEPTGILRGRIRGWPFGREGRNIARLPAPALQWTESDHGCFQSVTSNWRITRPFISSTCFTA
jgi:hypothetical protein